MADKRNSFRRLFGPVLQVNAATLIVFVVLVIAGALDPVVGLCALAVAILGSAIVLWRFLDGILAFRNYVDDIAGGDDPDVPRFGGALLARELSMSVRRLDRAWRQRTNQIKASLDANRAIINALPHPLLLLGKDRAVTRANDAAKTVFEIDPAGKDLAAAMRVPDVLTAADKAIEESESSRVGFVLPFDRQSHYVGYIRPLPIHAPDGGRVVMVLQDISDSRKNEQMRADFAANASHEIRTPLTAIVGFIETLKTVGAEDKQNHGRFLDLMEDAANRILHLVDDLLALSRIEKSEESLPEGFADIGSVLTGAQRIVSWESEKRTVAIEMKLPEQLPMIRGDSTELTHLFKNLLENAIKYGREGGWVRVSISEAVPADKSEGNSLISVHIADNGIGIAKEHVPRLTERFFRVDKARSSAMGGTGLGLAIVKHIVGRHRGELAFSSEIGRGTEVIVSLPAADQFAALDETKP